MKPSSIDAIINHMDVNKRYRITVHCHTTSSTTVAAQALYDSPACLFPPALTSLPHYPVVFDCICDPPPATALPLLVNTSPRRVCSVCTAFGQVDMIEAGFKECEKMGVTGSPWRIYVEPNTKEIYYHNFETVRTHHPLQAFIRPTSGPVQPLSKRPACPYPTLSQPCLGSFSHLRGQDEQLTWDNITDRDYRRIFLADVFGAAEHRANKVSASRERERTAGERLDPFVLGPVSSSMCRRTLPCSGFPTTRVSRTCAGGEPAEGGGVGGLVQGLHGPPHTGHVSPVEGAPYLSPI